MLTKLTNIVQALTELPNALHACVEMAREAEARRNEMLAHETESKHKATASQLSDANARLARWEMWAALRFAVGETASDCELRAKIEREQDKLLSEKAARLAAAKKGLDVERFISDERWAWARERIESLTQEANDLARAAEQERRELAREREARRPRKQSDEPCPLTGDEQVLWRLSKKEPWTGAPAWALKPYHNAEWRYVSPEDMP